VIRVEGGDPIVLGRTCKYCSRCGLIIAHKHELKALLAAHYSAINPDVVFRTPRPPA
jgi:hypothetical protein